MKRRGRTVWLAGAALALATPVHASSLVTTDPVQVTAFVGTATRLGFDDVTGSAGGLGSAVPAGAQIAANYQDQGVLISSTGGPAYAAARAVDAVSDPNLLGGTNRNASNVLITAWLEPVTIDFVLPGTTKPAPTNRVGAWNDPTGSRIRLEVFDAAGELIESVEANQGNFLGIAAPGIVRARFVHIQTQSVVGFTVDDLYFDTPATAVPFASRPGAGLIAVLLGALGVRALRDRRNAGALARPRGVWIQAPERQPPQDPARPSKSRLCASSHVEFVSELMDGKGQQDAGNDTSSILSRHWSRHGSQAADAGSGPIEWHLLSERARVSGSETA